jgi:tetratricopeptide (TPR) repeat protein
LARLLIEAGDYARADAMSATAIEKGPRDAAALAVRGQMLAMKGDKQGGVELLSQACNLDPEDAEAQFQLGSIYDRAKLPADAVKHFKEAAILDPADARVWDYLALNLEPLGDIQGAAEAYKKALQVNHEGAHFDAFVDYNYGRFLMKEGDLTASRAHLDRAVELVPDMRATWYERARLDLRQKDYQGARKDAETAAKLADPDGIIINLQIYAILEQIYRRLGETTLADKYAELGRETPPPVRGERH